MYKERVAQAVERVKVQARDLMRRARNGASSDLGRSGSKLTESGQAGEREEGGERGRRGRKPAALDNP